MALQTSGTISFSEVRDEFQDSNPVSMSEFYSADDGLPASGVFKLSNFYGKRLVYRHYVTSNKTNYDLRSDALAGGWDGLIPLLVTINSGVIISGDTAANSTPALNISGSFPQGLELVNNGVIVGRGGYGGYGGPIYANAQPGQAGGRAMLISSPVQLTNNGTIAGGGGGGGGGACGGDRTSYGGSGGGGGRSSYGFTSTGGRTWTWDYPGDAGDDGSYSAAGDGGVRVGNNGGGGDGGNWGEAGGDGQPALNTPHGAPADGGAGGQAVSGNSYVTWIATGTRYGALV